MANRNRPASERFWEKVNKTDTCWLWTAADNGHGYPIFHLREGDVWKQRYAHRLSYQWAVGPIPDGLTIDHLCRVTRCVRPDHLEAVTQGENDRRGHGFTGNHYRATHCVSGHAFDVRNTHWTRSANGNPRRKCRECHRLAEQRRRESARAA